MTGRMLIPTALMAVASFWLAASVARAAPMLGYRAPVGCADEASVRRMIERELKQQGSTLRHVEIDIAERSGGYDMALTLRTRDATYDKRLFAVHCSTLLEVVRLEVAFITLPAAHAIEEKHAPTRLAWGSRLSASLASSPLPSPSGGLELSLFLDRAELRLELFASYGLPRELRYASERDVGGLFDAIGGGARACYLLSLRKVLFPLCAGGEVAALRGRGLGLSEPFEVTRLSALVFAGPAFQFKIYGPVSGWVEVQGLVQLTRPAFGVRNLPLLYRADRFGARGMIGVAFTIE